MITRRSIMASLLAAPAAAIAAVKSKPKPKVTLTQRDLHPPQCYNCQRFFSESKWLPDGVTLTEDKIGAQPGLFANGKTRRIFARICDPCIEAIKYCAKCGTELRRSGYGPGPDVANCLYSGTGYHFTPVHGEMRDGKFVQRAHPRAEFSPNVLRLSPAAERIHIWAWANELADRVYIMKHDAAMWGDCEVTGYVIHQRVEVVAGTAKGEVYDLALSKEQFERVYGIRPFPRDLIVADCSTCSAPPISTGALRCLRCNKTFPRAVDNANKYCDRCSKIVTPLRGFRSIDEQREFYSRRAALIEIDRKYGMSSTPPPQLSHYEYYVAVGNGPSTHVGSSSPLSCRREINKGGRGA